MNAGQQNSLFANTAASVGGASIDIQKKHFQHCLKADFANGGDVAKALGIPLTSI